MAKESVFYDLSTGKPADAVRLVRRRLSAYTREDKVARFKIGISNNPERRFATAYGKYDEMIVLYRSTSIDSVSEMERQLVEHNRELAANRIGGGGGDFGEPPYYLYVVLRHR